MDIQTPIMDGPTATRAIRGEEIRKGTHEAIFAPTANAMTHQIEAYLSDGMDGLLAKPTEIVRLFEVGSAVAAKF